MENHKLVLPEHLNHFGFLFGGYLLKWVDEVAWIGATLDYPGCNFVSIGMDKVEFRKSVRQGTILKFLVTKRREGRTSVKYEVDVRRGSGPDAGNEIVFSTGVTLVRVDASGNKMPLASR